MLVRWTSNQPSYDPFREFRAIQRQMDHVFRDLLPIRSSRSSGPSSHQGPASNVRDLGDKYLIEAELPGIDDKDLELEATAEGLTIKGKRSVATPEGYAIHRSERSEIEFSRVFDFESKIDLEKVSAKLDRGILRVELGKRADEQPQTITVQVG